MAKAKFYDVHAIGKRKSAVARIYMVEGTGKIIINHRPLEDYFPTSTGRFVVNQPLNLLNISGKYDIVANVAGGGISAQAEAVRLGIGRGLCKLTPEVRPDLKKAGLLTRDSREVERKKYGVRGARRAFQFSKR